MAFGLLSKFVPTGSAPRDAPRAVEEVNSHPCSTNAKLTVMQSDNDKPLMVVRAEQHFQAEKDNLLAELQLGKSKTSILEASESHYKQLIAKLRATLEAERGRSSDAHEALKREKAATAEWRMKWEAAGNDDLQKQIQDAKTELEKTTTELTRVRQDNFQLRQNQRAAKAETTDLVQELKQNKNVLAETKRMLEPCLTELKQTRKDLRDAREKLKPAEEEAVRAGNLQKETQHKLERAEEELARIREELLFAEQEALDADEFREIQEELVHVKEELAGREEELKYYEELSQDNMRTIHETEEELKRKDGQLVAVEAEIFLLKKAAAEYEEKLSNSSTSTSTSSPQHSTTAATTDQRDEKLRNSFLKTKRKYDSLLTICKDISLLTRGMPVTFWGNFGSALQRLNAEIEIEESGGVVIKAQDKRG